MSAEPSIEPDRSERAREMRELNPIERGRLIGMNVSENVVDGRARFCAARMRVTEDDVA